MTRLALDEQETLDALKRTVQDGWAAFLSRAPGESVYALSFCYMIEHGYASVAIFTEEEFTRRRSVATMIDRFWPPDAAYMDLASTGTPPLLTPADWDPICEADGDPYFRDWAPYVEYATTVRALLIRSLREVDELGLFGDRRNEMIVKIDDLQGEDTVDDMIAAIRQLNPAEIANAHLGPSE